LWNRNVIKKSKYLIAPSKIGENLNDNDFYIDFIRETYATTITTRYYILKCQNCYSCIQACPKKAIKPNPEFRLKYPEDSLKIKDSNFLNWFKINHPFLNINNDLCVNCGICVNVCQFNALEIFEKNHFTQKSNKMAKIVQQNVLPNLKPEWKLDLDTCIKCGLCSKVCPSRAIDVEIKENISFNAEKCIGCNWCAFICPKDSISVKKVFQAKSVSFDFSQCLDNCYICFDVCPTSALSTNKREISNLKKSKIESKILKRQLSEKEYIEDFCIYCGTCIAYCPINNRIFKTSTEDVKGRKSLEDSRPLFFIRCFHNAETESKSFEFEFFKNIEDPNAFGLIKSENAKSEKNNLVE